MGRTRGHTSGTSGAHQGAHQGEHQGKPQWEHQGEHLGEYLGEHQQKHKRDTRGNTRGKMMYLMESLSSNSKRFSKGSPPPRLPISKKQSNTCFGIIKYLYLRIKIPQNPKQDCEEDGRNEKEVWGALVMARGLVLHN